jgi:putative heme-binding domain-containing protein
LRSVVEFIGKVGDSAAALMATRALGEGLRRAGTSLFAAPALSSPPWSNQIRSMFALASKTAADKHSPEPARLQGIQLLGQTTYAESGQQLLALIHPDQPQAVQLAGVSTLARFGDSAIGPELIKRWELFTPPLRSAALSALLTRPERAVILLRAIQDETIRSSILDSTQTKFLRNHRDRAVRDLAGKVLGLPASGARQKIIDAFIPALELKGDPARGHKLYRDRCISCHRLGGEGFALGPDLVTVKNTGKEKLLVNILDPNREVRPEFASYLVETKDDESLIGIIAAETGTAITLRQAYGKEDVVQRSNIRRTQSQGQSLMPEGLEAGMTQQDVADLLEYIERAEEK